MKKNVGSLDRILRIVTALVMGGLYFTGAVDGTVGLVLLVFSIVFLATSAISFCPLYTIFGMSTCPVEQQ